MTNDGSELIRKLCDSALAVAAPAGLTGISAGTVVGTQLLHLIYASDPTAQRIWELHLTLGEGPGLVALTRKAAVLNVDLAAARATETGVVFASEAEAIGVGSLWCIPLVVGAVTLGLITLHGTCAAPPSQSLISRVLAISDTATMALLSSGHVMQETGDPGDQGSLVHQAAGMVMVQLGVPLPDAMGALRAKAFASDMSLNEVARAVVERRLRFNGDVEEESF